MLKAPVLLECMRTGLLPVGVLIAADVVDGIVSSQVGCRRSPCGGCTVTTQFDLVKITTGPDACLHCTCDMSAAVRQTYIAWQDEACDDRW